MTVYDERQVRIVRSRMLVGDTMGGDMRVVCMMNALVRVVFAWARVWVQLAGSGAFGCLFGR
jgi:hypothetical protein